VAVFHILRRGDWVTAEKAGSYAPPSLTREGFIHFSEDRQLLAVAERYFRGCADLVVLSVREDKLAYPLRREDVGEEKYPHLYGPLNLDAVVEVVELPARADGTFDVPEPWRPWAPYFGRRS
jgi:uncharacterized protein (DUF952 family)